MANRAGLRKVVKTVRTKKGVARRSYWVRGTDAVKAGARAAGGFVGRHKGAIAAGVLAAGLIGLNAYGHRQAGTTNTGAYAAGRMSGQGRVRSALGALGSGTGAGANVLFGKAVRGGINASQSVRGAASGARSRVANSDTVLNARIAGSVFSTVYDQQRGPGSGAGRLTSAYRAARSVWGGMRGA